MYLSTIPFKTSCTQPTLCIPIQTTCSEAAARWVFAHRRKSSPHSGASLPQPVSHPPNLPLLSREVYETTNATFSQPSSRPSSSGMYVYSHMIRPTHFSFQRTTPKASINSIVLCLVPEFSLAIIKLTVTFCSNQAQMTVLIQVREQLTAWYVPAFKVGMYSAGYEVRRRKDTSNWLLSDSLHTCKLVSDLQRGIAITIFEHDDANLTEITCLMRLPGGTRALVNTLLNRPAFTNFMTHC